MKIPYHEFDTRGLRSYPLASRPSKVRRDDLARVYRKGSGLAGWLASLPTMLAARDFSALVDALVTAHRHDRAIIWGLGAHVFKTGLSPILIDLMRRGFVSAIATNGAGVIHDFEIAVAGATSEDVDAALGPGTFGMAEETGVLLNRAINDGVREGLGLGQAIGKFVATMSATHGELSVAGEAWRLGIPLTVHVAIGTDIIHMHPHASGAALGEGSLRDFKYFTTAVSRLADGVYLNCGSAVILPEVFLKAVALVRHQHGSLDGLTTANLDFIRQYRPVTNVLTRPVAGVGQGLSLTGHHELLIPLLAAALIDRTDA